MADGQGSIATAIVDAVGGARGSNDPARVAAALLCVPASDLEAFLHARFEAESLGPPLTTGLGASPGAASGRLVLSADEALDAADAGHSVILVRTETTPDDVMGMQVSAGILTTRGGITSHAAVVARGWGIPAVVGAADIVLVDDGVRIADRHLPRGTVMSIDGRSGHVYAGAGTTSTDTAPDELDVLLGWADVARWSARRPVRVRANADTADDAAHARRMGAEGIGLCRTEHMFLADDRLPLVRRFILSDDPGDEAALLAELEVAQRADFAGILREMAGRPVTVRLLDPPLHEFLPDLEPLVAAEARGELDELMRAELAAARRLHEVNPMIGTRGVRLGVVRPGLYQMQVRALLRAVGDVTSEGIAADVEVMIPLVVDASEMSLARRWVEEAAASVEFTGTVTTGSMIETPRAALLADRLATVSDFFSFGTNDLTQLTFGFSRDDVGSKLLPRYVSDGLLDGDPFDSVDVDGVGWLVRHACEEARRVRPTMKIGVCGEHAGDPASARLFVDCGVDYVSCSPYRVPVTRLAVAQALVAAGLVDSDALAALGH